MQILAEYLKDCWEISSKEKCRCDFIMLGQMKMTNENVKEKGFASYFKVILNIFHTHTIYISS